jgi:hypothetical protein
MVIIVHTYCQGDVHHSAVTLGLVCAMNAGGGGGGLYTYILWLFVIGKFK